MAQKALLSKDGNLKLRVRFLPEGAPTKKDAAWRVR